MFVKLFSTILDSSIWGEDHATVRVWITLLCMADKRGQVRAAFGGLAHRANVTREEAKHALAILEGPDPESKDQDFAGRRVERVDGGWRIFNYNKYRELQSEEQRADAERKRRERASQRSHDVPDVSRTSADVHPHADAEASSEAYPSLLPAPYDVVLDRAVRASRESANVLGIIRDTIASPTSMMPKHLQFPPEVVGQALQELLAAGPFGAAGLRAFCQRIVSERTGPPKNNGRRETQQERNLRVIRETTAEVMGGES